MKYIKSTTQKSYTVNGKVIPACVTPGNKTLEVDDSEWFQISTQPVIASLIKSGDLLVLDEDPNVKEDTAARNQVAELTAKNTELEEKIRLLETQASRTASKGSSPDVETAKAEVAEWKQKYEDLQKQAVKELEDSQAKLDEALKELEKYKNKAKAEK